MNTLNLNAYSVSEMSAVELRTKEGGCHFEIIKDAFGHIQIAIVLFDYTDPSKGIV
jgi:hypothetical protein